MIILVRHIVHVLRALVVKLSTIRSRASLREEMSASRAVAVLTDVGHAFGLLLLHEVSLLVGDHGDVGLAGLGADAIVNSWVIIGCNSASLGGVILFDNIVLLLLCNFERFGCVCTHLLRA